MSKRYPGGLITKNPNFNPTPEGGASGIWTLDQAIFYQQLGTWPSATDPYFNQTTLLLHGDGTNGAQNNTFLDSSTNNFTITRNGNTTQGTFSPFSVADGEWSNYFNGSSALSFEPGSITIGSGTDFCIEAWVYPTNLSAVNGGIFQAGTQDGSLAFRHNTNGTLRVLASAVSSQLDTTTALTNNEWYHIAATRSSGTLRIFINGVEDASTADSTDYTDPSSSNDFVVGGRFYSSAYQDEFYGYISNLRFVVGSAVYTSGFTPSTTPLTDIANTELLTCQSNRFVDNSSNALVGVVGTGTPSVQSFSPFQPSSAYSTSVNGGSGYFDGTGDYLTVPDDADFSLGSNNFCLEAWVYAITAPSYAQICGQFGPGGVANSDRAYWIRFDDTGKIQGIVTTDGSTTTTITAGTALSLNAWHHIALVRNSNNLYLYIDGVQAGTTAFASSIHNSSETFSIGGANNGAEVWNGYISNVRLVNGSAVYTSAFTPPTAPLTAIANTQLLLNYTNAGIFDNTGKNNLETVGDAQIDTTTKKYGTGSMEFDGTGDYLAMGGGQTQNFAFGSGNFTIEMWIYFDAVNVTQTFLDGRPASTNGAYPLIYLNSNGTIRYFVDSADRITGTTNLSASTWYHLAISRSGTSTKMFLDGVQEGSTYTDSNSYLGTTNRPIIGCNLGTGSPTQVLDGFIDDLRITKGVARYTANFTPPGGPFQNS